MEIKWQDVAHFDDLDVFKYTLKVVLFYLNIFRTCKLFGSSGAALPTFLLKFLGKREFFRERNFLREYEQKKVGRQTKIGSAAPDIFREVLNFYGNSRNFEGSSRNLQGGSEFLGRKTKGQQKKLGRAVEKNRENSENNQGGKLRSRSFCKNLQVRSEDMKQ